MAHKDHSLDDKIAAAAREEFLEKGYSGASLRKIAEKAGATVGAIRTRYRSKDELFGCLVKPFLDMIGALFQSTKADYYSGAEGDFPAGLKAAMRRESAAILHLIFEHYDEAELLLCRSAGSSLERYFDGIVQSKIGESLSFFHEAGLAGIDEGLLGLLISAQFDSYRRIVAECPDRGMAEKYMESLMTYHFGGWVAFFESVNRAEEEK